VSDTASGSFISKQYKARQGHTQLLANCKPCQSSQVKLTTTELLASHAMPHRQCVSSQQQQRSNCVQQARASAGLLCVGQVCSWQYSKGIEEPAVARHLHVTVSQRVGGP
jgi:hypothetical protein